jgi:hypothetical protein
MEDKTEILAGKVNKPEATKQTPPLHMKHYTDERTSIVRQSCLKAAVGILGLSTEKSTTDKALIKRAITLAEGLESWVNRKENEVTDSKN